MWARVGVNVFAASVGSPYAYTLGFPSSKNCHAARRISLFNGRPHRRTHADSVAWVVAALYEELCILQPAPMRFSPMHDDDPEGANCEVGFWTTIFRDIFIVDAAVLSHAIAALAF